MSKLDEEKIAKESQKDTEFRLYCHTILRDEKSDLNARHVIILRKLHIEAITELQEKHEKEIELLQCEIIDGWNEVAKLLSENKILKYERDQFLKIENQR